MNNSEKLMVKCEEERDTHPHCPHGPMLLFYRASCPEDGYFACSAFRNKNLCGHSVNLKGLRESVKRKRYLVEINDFQKLREKIKSVSESYNNFCHDCNRPYSLQEVDLHSSHTTVMKITEEVFSNPTSFLKPLDNDKIEAQYFFDQESLKFFASILEQCQINKVVCIGAPRLHAYLRAKNSLAQSFLLDFDHRYFYFYDDDQFAWYNMCNNHFFDNKQRLAFEGFLKANDGNLAFFVDPPFGCRTEVVANSIKQLSNLYRSIIARPEIPCVLWVYPYFCDAYVRQVMPELEMSDYKVNYTNHKSYSSGVKGRKLGSPVRLFTNIPLELIVLPSQTYKYCEPCRRWTANENQHCSICKMCPSKNGSTYRHCFQCHTCVKPNYSHCTTCRRCTQRGEHNCEEYQLKIRCWICREVGHNEVNCPALRWKKPPKSRLACLICGKSAKHNEKTCHLRGKYIQERSFMGTCTLEFKTRNSY